MPEIDINLKRGQNVRIDLETFWNENIDLNNLNNKLIPLNWNDHSTHATARYPDIEHDLFIPIGKNESGYVTFDLSIGNNLLVGGSMLSGVGMFRRVSLLSLLKKHSPNTLKVILLDSLDFMSDFDSIPHLLYPRATLLRKSMQALDWCKSEIDQRYNILSKSDYSSAWHHNKNHPESIIPSILVVISELGDFKSISGMDTLLYEMAGMTRATNIHFLITTQQPSEDIITPRLKEGFSNRIAFQMPYEDESKLFIDEPGAQELLGQGDMLFKDGYNDQILHLQGLYCPIDETKSLATNLCQY